MSRLTVTEKEHWKSRIENRIQKAISLLEVQEPTLMSNVKLEAKRRTYEALGIETQITQIERNKESIKTMQSQEQELMDAMYSQVLGRKREPSEYQWQMQNEFNALVTKKNAQFEEELLGETPVGKDILRLQSEMESLLDTVWLATSSVQIRDLWMRVSSVIGDEATELQQKILASTSDENKSE